MAATAVVAHKHEARVASVLALAALVTVLGADVIRLHRQREQDAHALLEATVAVVSAREDYGLAFRAVEVSDEAVKTLATMTDLAVEAIGQLARHDAKAADLLADRARNAVAVLQEHTDHDAIEAIQRIASHKLMGGSA